MLLVLALPAAVFQSAQAQSVGTKAASAPPSCDITDLNCIKNEFQASLTKNQGSLEDEYAQFAQMIAPVLLLAHGGNFEASLASVSCMHALRSCTWLQSSFEILPAKHQFALCFEGKARLQPPCLLDSALHSSDHPAFAK